MCAHDKSRMLAKTKFDEFKSDAKKQAIDDTKSRFNSVKKNLGFYDKVGETLAKLQECKVMLQRTEGKFGLRIHWLNVLLGVTSIGGSEGIQQALDKDEYKFDLTDMNNSLSDFKAQLKAVEGLTVEESKEAAKSLKEEQKTEIKKLVNKYKSTPIDKKATGKQYKLMKDEDVEDMLETVRLASNPKKAKESKVKELKSQITGKENELGDSEKAKKEYNKIVFELSLGKEHAKKYIETFSKRHSGSTKIFKGKLDKIVAAVKQYSDSSSEGFFKKAKRGGGGKINIFKASWSRYKANKKDQNELKAAAGSIIRSVGVKEDTSNVNKSLDALVSTANLAKDQYEKLSTSQIAGYKRMSEALIDGFIDFHRDVEKRVSQEVIKQTCKNVILNIRKENRTYFKKETMDENKKVLKELRLLEGSELLKSAEIESFIELEGMNGSPSRRGAISGA